MSEFAQSIHSVQSGVWVMEAEQGGYYYLCRLGIWIEFQVRNGSNAGGQFGARWSIDKWATHHDTPAFFKQPLAADGGLWRVEIENAIITGWRDGSIGGPNGEQPSLNRWILWGKDKHSVKSLPLGTALPQFEFALYLKQQGSVYWENNQGHNFSLSLNNVC